MKDAIIRTLRDPFFQQFIVPMIAALLSIMAISALIGQAMAQDNHAAGHEVYKQWRSEDNTNCCDGRDCGTLAVDGERWTAGQLEVQIEGAWCPVKPGMFVRKHKSPDWNVPHVCVTPADGRQPCERLRCYMGKGSF